MKNEIFITSSGSLVSPAERIFLDFNSPKESDLKHFEKFEVEQCDLSNKGFDKLLKTEMEKLDDRQRSRTM